MRIALVLVLWSTPALAVGPAGLGGGLRPASLEPPSRLQQLDVGVYVTPLFGYESNYQVTTKDPLGSGVWALEAGGELRYRASPALRLHLELGGVLRLPFEDASLIEYSLELPAMLLYRLASRLELVLASHLGVERSKTPPVFIDPGDLDPALLGGANRTIRMSSVQEELQPRLGVDLARWARLEAGPYLRVKWVSFLDRPWEGEPDYTLLDGGGTLSVVLRWRDRLSFRLRYDLAGRFFLGYPARPPARQPVLGEDLTMTRHGLGARLRGRIWGPLGAQVGYLLRITGDNGGFYAAMDHQPSAGLWLDTERVDASASVAYLWRGYRQRTLCEAEEEPPGTGRYLGADCKGLEQPAPLPQWEAALVLDARVSVTLIAWLQAVATYELELARSEVESVTNHRGLGGLGFSF